jgi:ParB-like chromosome segregation protein Spo0J
MNSMAKKKVKHEPKPPAENIHADLLPLAVEIDTLVFDPANARTHSPENLKAIAGSLARFGQRTPVVVNRRGNIIEKGNGTVQAAKEILGWKRIAALMVDDDPATQTGYSIADNRTAELADWDEDALTRLVATIEEADQELYEALLLEDLVATEVEEEAAEEGEGAGGDQAVPEMYQVIVNCTGQDQQQKLFEEMKERGLACRLLTL